MPGLTLHIGPQKEYYYFLDKIIAHQPDSFLYLLPVNRAVRYINKQLVSRAVNQALIEPYIFTFDSLTRYIYPFLPYPRKIIPRSMRLVLINQVLQEQGKDLLYFKHPEQTRIGFIDRVDRMLDEFGEFGYQPGDFKQPPPTCQDKYKDFGKIFAFLHHKYNDQLLDERGVIAEVVRSLDFNLFREIFPPVKFIYINGYGIYTPPMIEFIAKVKDWCQVEIKLEYNEQNQELFAHTRPAFEALQKFASSVMQEKSQQDLLYRHFFKTDFTATPLDRRDKITWQVLKNKDQEIAFIAATIKELHQQSGLPLSRFGVTFPDLEKYAPQIRNIFEDSGLAYNLSTGFSLAQSAVIQAYLQVLKVAAQGFDCEQIYTLLLSPFLKNSFTGYAATWQRLTALLRMKHLSSDWQQRVYAYINFKKDQQAVGEEEIDGDFLVALEKIMINLPAIIQCVQSLPANATSVQFKEQYVRVLMELGLLEWVEQEQPFLNRQEQERNYRAFNRFIKLLEQLTWILRFPGPEQTISLADYYRYLSLLVQQATYNLREWSNYGVQIMPVLEIQALQCKYLFIGGLLEGNFPRHFRRDIFFNDQERQQMGLSASEDILNQDRFLFYQLLSSPAEQIYLTCPRFEEDIELLPSTFLASLRDSGYALDERGPVSEIFTLTRGSFIDYLATVLKTGLGTAQQEWFKNWLTITGLPAAAHWLTGVEISYNKLNRSSRNRFEGNLADNPLVGQHLRNRLGNKPFSITALESYAFCPMQYFLERILKLEEEPEIEDEITALEKGSLVHRILFRFYTELKSKNGLSNPKAHYDLLLRIAGEEFDRLPYSGLLWTLEKETYFGREGLRPGLWEKFLELETEEITTCGFKPSHFEVAFGRVGNGRYQDALSSPQAIAVQHQGKKVRLIGKIDRADINVQHQLLVFDYKISSRVDRVKVENIYRGESLQLPVYLYVIGQLLPQIDPLGAGYYQVRDADHCQRRLVFAGRSREANLFPGKKVTTVMPVRIDDQEITLQNLIDKALDFIVEYTDSIKQGKFYHTTRPDDERCRSFCPYNKVCRKDVAKLKALAVQAEN
jgi:ATP-dependent helicase/nuclease subunit B